MWYGGIYTLVMIIIYAVFHFVNVDNSSWMAVVNFEPSRIYMVVIGVIYPLTSTKFYVSQGLTRKQYFWSFLSAISLISLFLLMSMLISDLYYKDFSLLNTITQYFQMPLFFLIGWTGAVGFQFGKWHTMFLGVFSAILTASAATSLPGIFDLSSVIQLFLTIILLVGVMIILPRIVAKVPLKS